MASLETDNLGLPITGTESGGKRAVDVNIAASDVALGGGTQYTEGDTDATITGTAMLMEGAGNALVPVQGNATDGVLVNLGANNDISGTVTANAGTNLNTSALALETGGNLAGAATSLAVIDDWDESDRAKVNPIVGQAGVSGGSGTVDASTQRVVLATDVSLPTGTNAIGKLSANSGVDIGDVDVTSISAGSNLIGDVGLSGARTSGGTTPYKNLDVDESEDEIKSTAGQVYWIHCMNLANAKRYLKFYNATAANVVVGTTVPVLTFALPTQGDTNGAGFNLAIPNGIAFSTAITVAATTGFADNDSGAPGANEIILNLGYA